MENQHTYKKQWNKISSIVYFFKLGHSNIGITMDLYSHLYEEVDREVAEMFDNLIKEK